MKLITWNVRGMGSGVKCSSIRKLFRIQRVEVAFLQETKKESITEAEIGRLWYEDKFEFRASDASGRSGGLITIWDKSKFYLEGCIINGRFILVEGNWIPDGKRSILMNMYAPCNSSE
ncbi:hypothetical protein HRI_004190100 [Hibiscus trionum]|uniref:Uncharacterized protein n=1 Tax=Hibiscus trionum TaxID=183268 RepID=A0A9W7J1K6_HIBTR|nr:hypothetical protein HRI_004190100 [Hibiscus trionum]